MKELNHCRRRLMGVRFLVAAAMVACAMTVASCGGTDEEPRPTPSPEATRAFTTSTLTIAAPTEPLTPPPVDTPIPVAEETSAPATSTPDATGLSGIRGAVYIGPTCPVAQVKSPCPDRPFAANIQLLNPSGRVLYEVRAGDDGRFEIIAEPGTYTLHPLREGALSFAQDQVVVVGAGVFTEVVVTYDSGIR